MKLLGLFLTSVLALASSDTSLKEFSSGNLKFTARLYKEILKVHPNKNIVFSPFSIEVILALTRAGAKGSTANEFTTALNLPDESKTEEALKQFLPTFKSTEDLKLLSANRLFAGKKFQITESFKQLATGSFGAGIENVDFSKNMEASQLINNWVAQQTNNKIKDLIDPESIDALTRLVLVNALYFSGKWETPFENWTIKEKFHLSSTQTKEVDMMLIEDYFKYYESKELNAKFLELPYTDGNVSMTIVLPNEKEGLSAIENNLEAFLVPQKLEWQRVSVRLPRFLIESDLKLKPILQNLGLKTVFGPNADLSGISNDPLIVDDVVQKAFINVTTSGTEAAAATAEKIHKPCNFLPPNAVVIANHPFFFYISSINGNTILLTGVIKTFEDYYDIFYKQKNSERR